MTEVERPGTQEKPPVSPAAGPGGVRQQTVVGRAPGPRLQPPSDYAPKYCRSRFCRRPFGHEDECDGPRSVILVPVAPSRRASLRAKGLRNRAPIYRVHAFPKALPHAAMVQVRPADIHPRHFRRPA